MQAATKVLLAEFNAHLINAFRLMLLVMVITFFEPSMLKDLSDLPTKTLAAFALAALVGPVMARVAYMNAAYHIGVARARFVCFRKPDIHLAFAVFNFWHHPQPKSVYRFHPVANRRIPASAGKITKIMNDNAKGISLGALGVLLISPDSLILRLIDCDDYARGRCAGFYDGRRYCRVDCLFPSFAARLSLAAALALRSLGGAGYFLLSPIH